MSNIKVKQNKSLYGVSGRSLSSLMKKDFHKNYSLYIMVLPVIAFYIIFCYVPMYGAVIAFKDYSPAKGIIDSAWVGLKHFKDFWTGPYFDRVLRNTLIISVSTLLFGFPAPIILALLINEIRSKYFQKIVQTITYLPYFISLVVVAGIIKDFTVSTGVVNDIATWFGGERVTMLTRKEYFVPIYVVSEIWQTAGWSSIIYIAALTSIDPQLYEACIMDGAGRWKQTWHITLPGIMPTIIIMLILRIGNLLNVGFEKIILLYNASIYETSDVISTLVYRLGLQEFNWSYSTAVGLFNSCINFVLLIFANVISKKLNGTGLW